MLGLGLGLVLSAYLSAPPDALHADGIEGEQFLGRYWEPGFVLILPGTGYVLFLVGVGVGAFTRELAVFVREEGQHRRSRST